MVIVRILREYERCFLKNDNKICINTFRAGWSRTRCDEQNLSLVDHLFEAEKIRASESLLPACAFNVQAPVYF